MTTTRTPKPHGGIAKVAARKWAGYVYPTGYAGPKVTIGTYTTMREAVARVAAEVKRLGG